MVAESNSIRIRSTAIQNAESQEGVRGTKISRPHGNDRTEEMAAYRQPCNRNGLQSGICAANG